MEIVPAIMPRDTEDLLDSFERIEGAVRTVQLDVMDGSYVESVSWPYFAGQYDELERIGQGELLLPHHGDVVWEVDLMVAEPEREAVRFAKSGARRLIVHLDSVEDGDMLDWLIMNIRRPGELEIGLAVSASVDLDALAEYTPELDVVQFMGIRRIGYQGQPFDPAVIDSVRGLRARDDRVIISVDGGVSLETAPLLLDAGADRLVSGSGIFGADDPVSAIEAFHRLAV